MDIITYPFWDGDLPVLDLSSQMADGAQLWCFLFVRLCKLLNKQSSCRWVVMTLMWRQCIALFQPLFGAHNYENIEPMHEVNSYFSINFQWSSPSWIETFKMSDSPQTDVARDTPGTKSPASTSKALALSVSGIIANWQSFIVKLLNITRYFIQLSFNPICGWGRTMWCLLFVFGGKCVVL